MTFCSTDIALNLLWLAIGVAGLAGLVWLERQRYHASGPRARRRRLAAVLIATICLFPSVSFTDDLLGFSLLNSHFGHHRDLGNAPPEETREQSALQLMALLDRLSNCEVAAFCNLVLAALFLGFISLSGRSAATRSVLCRAGRSPPLA